MDPAMFHLPPPSPPHSSARSVLLPPPILSRLPSTLSGPVETRARGAMLRRPWRRSTAHLKGSALVLRASSAAASACALDVVAVERLTRRRLLVRAAGARSIELRAGSRLDEWEAALSAAARAPRARLADFEVVAPVGKGGGGTVFLVRDAAGEALAMKVVQKDDAFYSDGALRHAVDERVVLELVRDFPFLITLRYAFQTDSALYMLSEFCGGGNLGTVLRKLRGGRMEEERARRIIAQIVLAVEHLHSLNVIYRDVKPENVLLSADGDVRLCDFGLSKVLSTGRFGRTRSFCGSTSYMSPQVVSRAPYGIATDLWSLGALFYRMLVGRAPFDQAVRDLGARNASADIERRIRQDDVVFPSFLSAAACEMLQGLLRKPEEQRTNLQDLKEATFFAEVNWDEVLRQGVENAARAPGGAMDDQLQNFDAERLKSHGVALRDAELDAERPRRNRAGKEKKGYGSGFVSRKVSRMAGMPGRVRSDMHRDLSMNSIAGFGFSSMSELSLNRSDTDTVDSMRGP